MINVVVLGGGNVAAHMCDAFLRTTTINLLQVYARNIKQITHLKEKTLITNSFAELKKADIYIIAVSDDAIANVSSQIPYKSLVVHTSGAASIDALNNKGEKGVFYMLQSFSKEKQIDFNKIPFCLEAETKEGLHVLKSLANAIGKKIYELSSVQRSYLHVAAVFVNNFSNHMYTIGHDICERNEVPFEILQPLITETTEKIKTVLPKEAQTGPAKRGDEKTMKKHLGVLTTNEQDIYKLISKSIQKNGEEL